MVVPSPIFPPETLLFSFGGSSILGYLAAKAIRVIAQIAAIIIGVFVLILAFLSYKGWVVARWDVIQSQTQSYLYNATAQILTSLNHSVSNLGAHPSIIAAEGTPILAGVGFLAGAMLGIRK